MQPGTEELRFLLKWAFADVEAARSKAAPFNLLKAVIARRLVVPEVYDLMDRVQELLIKSHVRASSAPFCRPFATSTGVSIPGKGGLSMGQSINRRNTHRTNPWAELIEQESRSTDCTVWGHAANVKTHTHIPIHSGQRDVALSQASH